MNWTEIGEIARDPLATIGAHTVNHVMLAKTSDEAVRAELNRSRIVLDAAIGTAPVHLAYPFGDRTTAGPREFRIAAELGYKTAVTTRPGVLFADHARAPHRAAAHFAQRHLPGRAFHPGPHVGRRDRLVERVPSRRRRVSAY